MPTLNHGAGIIRTPGNPRDVKYLHLVTTLHGLPAGFALAGAKADERQVLLAILGDGSLSWPDGQVVISDKNYYGHDFERVLHEVGLVLLRPARKGEPGPSGSQYFRPLRQVIESVNDTLKGQLDLERHGGRTIKGVGARGKDWRADATSSGQPSLPRVPGATITMGAP